MAPISLEEVTYDILGLGFGPANLSIAAAVTEAWTTGKVRRQFLRRPVVIHYCQGISFPHQECPLRRKTPQISVAPWHVASGRKDAD